jgi:hypothetical protein
MATANNYSTEELNRYLLEQIKIVKADIEGQLAVLCEMERRAQANQYSWSQPQCMVNDTITVNSSLKEGVYSITHKDTPVYDGVGNVLPRVKKFKSTLIDPTETEIGHIGGLKAKRVDKDIRNYHMRYVMLENRSVANLLEEFYINIGHKPAYNDPKMAGK